jgi:8-oxo-dGTP pyrophosphatase MutT (NUDIX family)
MLRWVFMLYRIYFFFIRPVTLGVRVMMVQGGQVVLVRQTYTGGWFMPGGGIKRGETLEAAARREAAEEVGAELHDLRLVGAYSNFKEWKSDHGILFLSTDFSVGRKQDSEVAEVRWFPLDALPAGLWPGHRQRLEEYRDRKSSPLYGEW